MGYTWLGMRKLTWEEVLQRHEKGELAGCFRLYDDNSEAMIDRGYDFAGDILVGSEDIQSQWMCHGVNGYDSFIQ